jgi:polyisoprenoid-binding protein YceI
MKHRYILAAGMLAASLAVPSAHAADVYDIDPTHTFPTFEINHLGLSTFRGRFDRTEGSIELDLANRKGSADITVHVDSVSTGVAKLDEHLRADDFFNAAEHPTMRFRGTQFHFENDTLRRVEGELTLLGVTRPLTLTLTHFACKPHPMTQVQACGADLEGSIKRSDFGMDTYVPAVGDEVRLKIEVEAFKRG